MFTLPGEVVGLASLILAIVGSVWTLAWWLSNKFNSIMATFYKKIDEVGVMILDKLEYHERHDDARFMSINNDLWNIRVRNAARDGLDIEPRIVTKPADPI